MVKADSRALPAAVINDAIVWYVRRSSPSVDSSEERAFSDWCDANPDHAEAWQRISAMRGKMLKTLSTVAPSVARDVLSAPLPSSGRRRALKTLAWAGASATGLWLLREQLGIAHQWQLAAADLHTTKGQRRLVKLADGSVLQMDTGSAVDLRFDAWQRVVVMHQGQIDIITAPPPQTRRFIVQLPNAKLVPVGTHFGVKLSNTGTLLTVRQGAVDLFWRDRSQAIRVPAGQQLHFNDEAIGALEKLDDTAIAWTDGQIRVRGMPLTEFIAELARYQPGWIHCDPALANLRITAIHSLKGPASISAILETLPKILPVQVTTLTQWLTLVGPAPH